MPLGTVLLTVGAYVAIALLLLSLTSPPRWRWWIKGGAIVITGTVLHPLLCRHHANMFGWPTEKRLPAHFSLLATHVVEPDNFLGTDGQIYLWLRDLDENNVPFGPPRNFQIVYTPPLAEASRRRPRSGSMPARRLKARSRKRSRTARASRMATRPSAPATAAYEIDFTLSIQRHASRRAAGEGRPLARSRLDAGAGQRPRRPLHPSPR